MGTIPERRAHPHEGGSACQARAYPAPYVVRSARARQREFQQLAVDGEHPVGAGGKSELPGHEVPCSGGEAAARGFVHRQGEIKGAAKLVRILGWHQPPGRGRHHRLGESTQLRTITGRPIACAAAATCPPDSGRVVGNTTRSARARSAGRSSVRPPKRTRSPSLPAVLPP